MNAVKQADILKSKNITKVCYFHTDHFEPWSKGINEDTARGVDRFAKTSKESRFAEKMSLFYHTFLPFRLDQNVVNKAEPGIDAVSFYERSTQQNELARRVMLPLERDSEHEIQVHVHHESWTRNTEEYSKDLSRWVNTHSSAEMDRARLDRALVTTKQLFEMDIGRPVEKWAFIHGNWALNGSDRSICWIDDEIELLMQHGCYGDFTFPAGRGHCNPTILHEPYTCLPIHKPKGYDLPESQPMTIRRGTNPFSPERFFIWSSQIKADFSSLDYYSATNRETFKNTEVVVQNWLEKSVVLDGTLFIKTHAHSMKWEYEIEKGENPIPHLYPDIKAMFDLLEKVCETAGIELEVITVDTLMDRLQKIAATEEKLPQSVPAVSPLEASVSALGEAMTAWLDGSDERSYAAGDFYNIRIKGRRWIEDYELAVVRHVLDHYDINNTIISEVGCGLGTLTLVLAALGYRVKGIEGDKRRSAGANWLKNYVKDRYPDIAGNYTIVEGFYPDVLNAGFLEEGKTNLLVTTNLIHSFSATNQEKILKSALMFDRLILDSSRFGVNRSQAGTASKVEDSLHQHFIRNAIVFSDGTASLVEYTPRDALKVVADTTDTLLPHAGEVLTLATTVCQEWVTELHGQGAKDNFIEDKLSKQLIDKREAGVCKQLCRLFDPGQTRIVEVGSACGALALLLATQGFEVIGFEGNVRRAKAAEQLKAQWREQHPDHPIALSFIAQLFPKAYDNKLIQTGKRTVLLATNIVGTYSTENQNRLLAAAATFNDVVIDLGRFGINRDTQEQRTALLHAMATTHFQPSAPVFFNAPNEFWHFVVPAVIFPKPIPQPETKP